MQRALKIVWPLGWVLGGYVLITSGYTGAAPMWALLRDGHPAGFAAAMGVATLIIGGALMTIRGVVTVAILIFDCFDIRPRPVPDQCAQCERPRRPDDDLCAECHDAVAQAHQEITACGRGKG